jgi:hypothetical protein
MQLIMHSRQLNLRPLVGEIQLEDCSTNKTRRNQYVTWNILGEISFNKLNLQPMVREIIWVFYDACFVSISGGKS